MTMSIKMKDSGIDWIGEIPEHWSVKRLGELYVQRNERVSDKEYPPLSVTMKGILPQLETAAKTNDGDNRKLVKKGDFVINSRSDRRGSCGISDYDGSVSLINTVLCPKWEMIANFYNWLFHAPNFSDEYYKWGHGIVDDLWTTRWTEMKKICVVSPPIEEQQFIADFLDKKIGEIDSAIKEANNLIDKYKSYKQSIITKAVTKGIIPNVSMKDSGLPWIGEIPEHWRVMPNKYVMYKVKEIQDIYNNEDILSLSTDGVKIRDLDAGGKMPTTFDGYQKVNPGRLLMCLFDIDVTPRCIGLIKDEGLTSPAYSQFVVRENGYAPYYYYYYLNLDFDKILVHLAKNLRHSLTEDQLGAINVLVPSLSEQKAIADYLDDKCSQIDSIIESKNNLIKQLQEYKKSIIFEYVTGKKEVPNG